MDIMLHGVKKIWIEEARQLKIGGGGTRILRVVTRKGEVEINLYADNPALLELVQVDDIHEPEPAA